MLNTLLTSVLGAAFILITSTVSALSPEMHKKAKVEKPKCEGMQSMDHAKMNINAFDNEAMRVNIRRSSW